MLTDAGIDKDHIAGYCTEEFTHLAVAAAIAGDVADVCLGIEAAARRLKLDFIPLFREDYYLLAKRETVEREDIQDIVAVLRTESFRTIAATFPGYDASDAGAILPLEDVIARAPRNPDRRGCVGRSNPSVRPRQLLHRRPHRGIEAGAAVGDMGDDGRPHPRIPELADVLGDRGYRLVGALALEERADLVGHVDELVRRHRRPRP